MRTQGINSMKKSILLFLHFLLSSGLFAQGESDWWYFGIHAGIHFIDDTIEVVYDSEMNSTLGNTTMSDPEGNLLYYSNGASIYNSQNEYMENGDNIGWNSNGTWAMSFKPNPDVNEYFYFNPNNNEGDVGGEWHAAWYGIIDMDANGGLGELISYEHLEDSVMNFVASSKKANGVDYWVLFRKPLGNTYVAFSLTSAGLDLLNPIYSVAGDLFMVNDGGTRGELKINPQGNLLAFIHENQIVDGQTISNGKLELFHFNNETGEVGDRIILLDETNAPVITLNDSVFAGNGVEFSADGEKLYYSQFGELFQCNISILDSVLIQQSVLNFQDYVDPYNVAGLQLGKDGRLYAATLAPNLAVVHHPNIAGLEADFELVAVDLSPNYSYFYLPRFDPSLFSSGFTVSDRCINNESHFSLIYTMPYTYVHWDFGDGDESIEWEPFHSYENAGVYDVTLSTVVGGDTSIKSMEVIIEDLPSVDLGLDSALFCGGDTLILNAYNYASYYTWQDSSYKSTFQVVDEGKYYVQVKNICGVVSDTVNYILDRDNVHLGNDTLICIQEPLLLLANQSSATDWLWQDGSTLPFYEAESEGLYYVLVTTPCQFIYDSITVQSVDCALISPNIFTPNHDGVNDYFKVINLEMLDYDWSLEVFNRWGRQVYFSPSYQNNWDAAELSDGVYFYILRSSNTPDSYKGSVTIVRK